VLLGMKRIHQRGDTNHFADEWILLQMTWQMTADEIVCGWETTRNKWTPGDDYVQPEAVQDDEVTTAVQEQLWGTTGSQPIGQRSLTSASVAYKEISVGPQREIQETAEDIPCERCIMPKPTRYTGS
jgi:lysozyme family protein